MVLPTKRKSSGPHRVQIRVHANGFFAQPASLRQSLPFCWQPLSTAYAFGLTYGGQSASWTKETFGFRSAEYTQTAVPSSKKEIPAPLTSIANEMEMHGIPTTILPSYLPDGLVERDFQYNAVTQPESLYCLLRMAILRSRYCIQCFQRIRIIYYMKGHG